jgi:O-acetylserine/cysteine efflux transporter
MQPRHIALAILLSVFWGLNFVVITVALGGFPPVFLAALRFAIAGVPALFLPRPKLGWGWLVAISFTLFVVQFGLLFPAMAVGMPPGVASILIQVQAFITIGIAAAVLRERPTPQQILGSVIALGGLALIATTTGTNGITFAGFTLALGSAIAWAVGNVLLRRVGAVDIFALISWLAAIAAGPLLILALILDGPGRISSAVVHLDWQSIAAVLYIALVSTVFGYWAWGRLVSQYAAATAAPFSLLVPVTGTISAAIFMHESFGPIRLAGMALILAGLAVLVIRRRA